MRYAWYQSPIGRLLVARDEIAVRRITIPDRDPSRPDSPRRGATKPLEPASDWVRDDAGLAREIAELDAYFAGELRAFEMAVEPEGTAFRCKVWAELASIPYGETWSYGELARRAVGRTGAARAVGAANGANPVAIVLPCHRVIGANGSLVGYGGGLNRKAMLLAHERGEKVFGGLL
ncbi:MAG: methylated-DNA--[protein]-cysteine S-methyltransferase [Thiotrichales bacterium]|nr:methylated-DNA--[protein]-cysteine S-methyltransferase [Thiotrichales bacterium]